MVAPITDLGVQSSSRSFTDGPIGLVFTKVTTKHRYRQKKPFTLALPYSMNLVEITSYNRNSFPPGVPPDASHDLPFALDWVNLENLSYDRLKSKLYDKVGAGVDFAEYRQSVQSIVSTATALANSYRAVRKGRFGDAAKALRMKFIPKGVGFHKSAANNWLEYHFGWEPLVKDIHDALEVITDPVKSYSLERGRSHDRVLNRLGSTDFGSSREDWIANGTYASTQGARVKFATPGLSHTLDQWGISNPAVIVWELVPFSFVLDWFVNVGDCLSSMTDFAGMTLESIYRVRKSDITIAYTRSIKPGFGSGSNSLIKRHIYTERFTTLSGTVLAVRNVKPPSVIRGATAISLLVQALKS